MPPRLFPGHLIQTTSRNHDPASIDTFMREHGLLLHPICFAELLQTQKSLCCLTLALVSTFIASATDWATLKLSALHKLTIAPPLLPPYRLELVEHVATIRKCLQIGVPSRRVESDYPPCIILPIQCVYLTEIDC